MKSRAKIHAQIRVYIASRIQVRSNRTISRLKLPRDQGSGRGCESISAKGSDQMARTVSWSSNGRKTDDAELLRRHEIHKNKLRARCWRIVSVKGRQQGCPTFD